LRSPVLLLILIGEAVFINGGVDLLDDCVFNEVAHLHVMGILFSGFSDPGRRSVG
jgi:hypothetical protein